MNRRAFFFAPLALPAIAVAAAAKPAAKTATLTLQLDPAPFLAAVEAVRQSIDAQLAEAQAKAAAETERIMGDLRYAVDQRMISADQARGLLGL